MKPYRILKDFKGTQDGQHDCIEFKEGKVEPLSPGLAAIVVREGWAELATRADMIATREPVAKPDEPNDHMEARETKVTGPEETKPIAAMKHKDLVKLAKAKGIPVKIGMKTDELLAALQA